MRISYLIGIYKALHTVHGAALADEWVQLPNTNAIFGGQPPLTYIIRRGIDALHDIRKLLDGCAEGN
jgi:hypothetical protein